MATLHFHFDPLSPYAYLAWTQIHALADRHDATVRPRPTLLAALLSHHGHKGPAEIPPKRTWVFKDVVRRAHKLGVPLMPPPRHPFNPLYALRAVLAVDEAQQRRLIDALFAATWGHASKRTMNRGVDSPEAIARIGRSLGIDDLGTRITDPAVKAALRAETEAALAAGVFGVPTVRVDTGSGESELFWGLDSFDLLEDHLRGDDPVTPELLAKWRDLPVGAQR